MRNWNDCPKKDIVVEMFNALFEKSHEIFNNSKYPFGPEDKDAYKKLRIPSPRIRLEACSSGRYLGLELKRYREYKYKKSEYVKYIMKMIENETGILKINCPATTNVFFFETEDGITFVPSIAIYFDTDKLVSDLFNTDDYNEAYKYYEYILRHELGHVIDFMSFIGKPYDEFSAEFDRRDEIKAKVKEKLKTLKGLDYNRAYNEEIPDEVLANKYADFTKEEYEEFISFHIND